MKCSVTKLLTEITKASEATTNMSHLGLLCTVVYQLKKNPKGCKFIHNGFLLWEPHMTVCTCMETNRERT